MSRVSAMTIGLVLVLIGAQLFLVKSYLLTPSATQFVQEHFNSDNGSRFSQPGKPSANNYSVPVNSSASSGYPGQSWPYYQTDNGAAKGIRGAVDGLFRNSSHQTGSRFPAGQFGGKRFVPPRWIMWPFLFIGAVFFLHGAALKG